MHSARLRKTRICDIVARRGRNNLRLAGLRKVCAMDPSPRVPLPRGVRAGAGQNVRPSPDSGRGARPARQVCAPDPCIPLIVNESTEHSPLFSGWGSWSGYRKRQRWWQRWRGTRRRRSAGRDGSAKPRRSRGGARQPSPAPACTNSDPACFARPASRGAAAAVHATRWGTASAIQPRRAAPCRPGVRAGSRPDRDFGRRDCVPPPTGFCARRDH